MAEHHFEIGERETMPRVRILKAFRLTRDDGTQMDFNPNETNVLDDDNAEPGVYEVSKEDSIHPYLLAHSNKPPKPEGISPDSQEAIAAQAASVARLRQQVASQKQSEADVLNDMRKKRSATLIPPIPTDPIATYSQNAKNPMPRATPVGDEGDKTPVNPTRDANAHDAPRPK